MLKRLFLILALMALLLLPTARADFLTFDRERPASADEHERATLARMEIARAVLDAYFEFHNCPEEFSTFKTVEAWAEELPELYRTMVVAEDAWGRPIYIGCTGADWALLSLGGDGEFDGGKELFRETLAAETDADAARLQARIHEAFDRREGAGDDIFLTPDGWKRFGGKLAVEQERTLLTMELFASALRSHAKGEGAYPIGYGGVSLLGDVRDALQPFYISRLPLDDAWEHSLLYLSDGTGFVLVSPGVDGAYDLHYRWPLTEAALAEISGPTDDPDRDIVMIDGELVSWPASAER